MGKVEFKLDRAGVGQLLKSKEMAEMLAKEGQAVLGRLPSGYGMTQGQTSQRAKVTIGTRSIEASIDNKRNNTLLKALGR